MSTIVPTHIRYWGTFPSTAELPNVSGSATQTADTRVEDQAFVAGVGNYVCTSPVVGAATWERVGEGAATDADAVVYSPDEPANWPDPDPDQVAAALDSLAAQVVALGPSGSIVGPFTAAAIGVGSGFCVYGTAISGFIAPRNGSITAGSGALTVGPTDDSITVTVLIGGITPTVVVTFGIGVDVAYATAAAGTHAVSAGDLVVVSYEGGASLSNTPDLTFTLEFTPDA